LYQSSKFWLVSVVASALALAPTRLSAQNATPAAQQSQKNWKDRAEYDLYETIAKSSDPNVWLATLDKWKAQYPQSDYDDIRRQAYLTAYRQLNRPREALNAAADVLKDNPNNLAALSAIVGYVYTVVPPNQQTLTPQTSADLDAAEMASVRILHNLDTLYLKENRPPDMTDPAAAKAKPELKVFAQKTLGYVALERKDYAKAQAELTRALELDPGQGQVSFWLGTALLAQNKSKPELQSPALYDFARAAVYDGPNSLPIADRKQLQDYLSQTYIKYHGSNDGLDKLLASARTSAVPPQGFQVLSKGEIERQRLAAEEAEAKANPMLALWRNIRTALIADDGPAYFETNVKDALVPGGASGVDRFKGKLVAMIPPVGPKELELSVDDQAKAAVILKLDSALPGRMEPGGEIEFQGIAKSYTKDPFQVTFEVKKAEITGWTGKNEVSKKGAGQKKKS